MRLGAIFAVITVASAAVPACSGSVQLGGDANAADASGEEAGPHDDASASYDGLQCGYDFGCVQCQCTSGAWSCNQLACSDSGAPQCPSAAPGGSCTEYQLACDYKSGGGCETCECAPSGFWSCVGVSCPLDGGP